MINSYVLTLDDGEAVLLLTNRRKKEKKQRLITRHRNKQIGRAKKEANHTLNRFNERGESAQDEDEIKLQVSNR